MIIPKPPPKPPYHGSLTISDIDLNEPMNILQQFMFTYAPCAEPFAVSMRRLIAALRADGESELRPLTAWLTYRKHPELYEEERKTA